MTTKRVSGNADVTTRNMDSSASEFNDDSASSRMAIAGRLTSTSKSANCCNSDLLKLSRPVEGTNSSNPLGMCASTSSNSRKSTIRAKFAASGSLKCSDSIPGLKTGLDVSRSTSCSCVVDTYPVVQPKVDTTPFVGCTLPTTSFASVDLPTPLAPVTTTTSPRWNDSVKLSSSITFDCGATILTSENDTHGPSPFNGAQARSGSAFTGRVSRRSALSSTCRSSTRHVPTRAKIAIRL